MKAQFFNRAGQLVWECTKDARYEFSNLTKALKKGAISGRLLDLAGQVVDQAQFA